MHMFIQQGCITLSKVTAKTLFNNSFLKMYYDFRKIFNKLQVHLNKIRMSWKKFIYFSNSTQIVKLVY